MITIEPIPTPKDLYKALHRVIRCICNNWEFCNRLDLTHDITSYQKLISDTIQEFTTKQIPSSYPPSFAKQLRVYMYAYRHHRLGGVSRG